MWESEGREGNGWERGGRGGEWNGGGESPLRIHNIISCVVPS